MTVRDNDMDQTDDLNETLPELLFLCWPRLVLFIVWWARGWSRGLGFAVPSTLFLCPLRDFWLLLDHHSFEGLFGIPLCHWRFRFRRFILWFGSVQARNRDWGWWWPCPGGHSPVDKWVGGQNSLSLAQFKRSHSLKPASSTPSSSFRLRSSSS